MIESSMIIIFGATGDLTKRKLIPALYHLEKRGELPACMPIVCIGRRPYSREEFFGHLEPERFIKDAEDAVLQRLLERVTYHRVDLDTATPASFQRTIEQVESVYGCTKNKLFYLAVAPQLFDPIISLIAPLNQGEGYKRVLLEKPFGHDSASAAALQQSLTKAFAEDQIFRIDHYLGKALVQNIIAFRFSNALFEKGWSGEDIDYIQITAAETVGVETRAGYYDQVGAIRDMVQNHLLQLLSIVAMEPPKSLAAEDVRDETAKVMKKVRLGKVVRGQYGAGKGMHGYREEAGIAPDSSTETYAAFELFVDTPRWENTPFYVRTGKRLGQKYTRIDVVFKRSGLFEASAPNVLSIRVQPDEGISFSMNAKQPTKGFLLEQVLLDYCHPCHFGPNTPEAYESLLHEVLSGEKTLFTRWDWLQHSWSFIDALPQTPVHGYPAGSDGPKEADDLIAPRKWRSS